MSQEPPVFDAPRGRDLHLAQRYSRWAMWGCFITVLISALAIGGTFVILLRDPKVWRALENVARCQVRMQEVSGALDRYNQDKGHLPATLDELYPTYLADRVNLRCPADPDNTKTSSFILRPGVAWGKGDLVLVYCPHHPAKSIYPGKSAVEAGNVVPVIYQDGRVDREIGPLDRYRTPPGGVAAKR